METVTKKGGSAPCRRAVNKVIERKALDPAWRGEDSQAGGRRQELTRREQQALSRLVFRARAKAVVTIKYCQKCMPQLRRVSRWTISRALHRAGLAWLRRRVKLG